MNSFSLKTLAATACFLATLVGCSSSPVKQDASIDPAEVTLKESIRRSGELAPFTGSSQLATQAPAPVLSGPSISLVFPGEAKVLLPKIAAANGLKFNVLGPRPHLPLFISVNVKDVPLEVLLRDIALQFGQRASLALTADAIEIRYSNATN